MNSLSWCLVCTLMGWQATRTEGNQYGRRSKISEKLNIYGKKMFYTKAEEMPEQSFALDPGPSFNLLAKFLNNSEGETLKAIADVVGSRNYNEVKKLFKRSNEIITSSELTLRNPSKLYIDDEYSFCSTFKQSYSKYFRGKTGNADFDNPKKAAEKINNWLDDVEVDQTGNPDLVNKSVIRKDDGFILVSSFEIEFDYDTGLNPRKVEPIEFYSSPIVKRTVPALRGPAIVKYAYVKKYDTQFIGITLKGNMTLFILNPIKINGLAELFSKISLEKDLLLEILPLQKTKCVDLTLPLGKLTTQSDLTNAIKQVDNLGIIFDKKRAEFIGITKNCKPGVMNAFLSEVYVVDKMVEDNNYNEMKKPNKAEDVCPDEEELIKVEINHQFAFSVYSDGAGTYPPPAYLNGVYY